MIETEFNLRMRQVIRAHGFRCLHIREADEPGVLDLIVYLQNVIFAWIELKRDNEEVRTSQIQFMKSHSSLGMPPVYLMRLRTESGQVDVYRPNMAGGRRMGPDFMLVRTIPDYQQFDWRKFLIAE